MRIPIRTETFYSSNVTFVSDDGQFEAHKWKYFQIKFGNDGRLDTHKVMHVCFILYAVNLPNKFMCSHNINNKLTSNGHGNQIARLREGKIYTHLIQLPNEPSLNWHEASF